MQRTNGSRPASRRAGGRVWLALVLALALLAGGSGLVPSRPALAAEPDSSMNGGSRIAPAATATAAVNAPPPTPAANPSPSPSPSPSPPSSSSSPTSLTAAGERPWRGDFETGDLSQWSYLLNARGLSVVAAPVAEGRYAARVEIQNDDRWPNGLNRVEVQHKPAASTEAEGADGYYAWGVYLPAPLGEARHQLGYWESDRSFRQIMSFEARGTTIAFVTRLPSERVWWTGTGQLTAKTWHRLAMHVRWSTDPAVGSVDVWFDGRQVVRRAAARTRWDNPAFLQIGILRDVPGPAEELFLDAAAEGATLGDVLPARMVAP
jgi:hypothetical protein